jgi:nitrite reductase (cytochrome c-552)
MQRISEMVKKKPYLGWLLFAATMAATFGLGLFASSIMERRVESQYRFQMNTPIGEWESDPAKWKDNFPRQHETWKQTADSTFKSKHGGSAWRDSLEEYPQQVVMWAGYAFSREYNQSRGHAHTVEDVRNILRTGVPQPGTCWTCKSSDVPRLMNEMGIAPFYASKWAEMGPKVKHPVGCLDCHDPKTMNLRISRPALVEAFERQGKNIRNASQQDMRSLVCAQCHVEYYFKDKKTFYLNFPWDKGMTVENIEEYYDNLDFSDWVHPLSKARMLKAQHPDYEIFQASIHAQRGLSCADCHMPYRSEGGVKMTDHHIQSPLNNVANSCQVCHTNDAKELIQNVYDRQDKITELRLRAQDAITRAHIEAKMAWDKGATEEEMKPILQNIRHAQWRWDYVVASVGGSFHAPLESARILTTAVDKGQQARIQLAVVLAKHGYTEPVPMPDISTKAKAQEYIGLNMKQLHQDKQDMLKNEISKWDEQYDQEMNKRL